ncbi:MAG: NADH-quinone oxidoreductase subunit C [Deltaproteobacteria bacterium]|nr:NADH-quinone oxidoreductase subunit C [Deltaproteobacteria bacterium]
MHQEKTKHLQDLLSSKFKQQIVVSKIDLGDLVVEIQRESVGEFFKRLKEDPDLTFNMLTDVTAVDWLDKKSNRFEVVYHLRSFEHGYFVRVKVALPESDPTIDSVLPYWHAADFLESEVWDMYGINFRNNPDIRRMMMYEEFEGHPLRKDYPVQGKQPRIEMRYPEVRNTAKDMVRHTLVQINKSDRAGGAA